MNEFDPSTDPTEINALDIEKLTRLEKLQLVSYIAPRVRSGEFIKRTASVKVIQRGTNEVIKEIPTHEVIEGLLKRLQVETDLTPDPERCSEPGCLNKATKESLKSSLKIGCKPYCETHKGGAFRPAPLPQCSEPGCSALASRISANASRSQGNKPYCENHLGGPRRTKPPLPCTTCGQPATRISSNNARRNSNRKPYCEEHTRKGAYVRKPLLPCSVCGQPSTRSSSRNARLTGGKAYCKKHRSGKS